MNASLITSILSQKGLRIFSTADLAKVSGLSIVSASQRLIRLSRVGSVTRLKKGVWVNNLAGGVNPYEAVPSLVSPWPCYVSLYSALSDYGIVAEIPHVIYAVTTANPRRIQTPVGGFSFHHLPERLMWGFVMQRNGSSMYPIAEPEKAFLDLCYLGLTLRSPLGLPRRRTPRWNLDGRRVRTYASKFAFKPLSDYIKGEKFS